MQIINASSQHIPFIARQLSSHFVKLNFYINYSEYKTDIALMTRVVTERIEHNIQDFKYFILVDESNDVPIGFSNIMIKGDKSEILAIVLEEEYATKDNYALLLDYSIQYLKQQGSQKIYIQVHDKEIAFKEAILEKGGKNTCSNILFT